MSETYDASKITVLEGLDPVRTRPGMYIGSTGLSGLHHLVWEVVDNSVDEAMAGFCDVITVTINSDGSCSVEDNGRGIPVGNHPQFKGKSAAEVVLTTLHAGGKFGDGGYKVSGGLHGVGISVVNALSRETKVEIYRDAKHHLLEFEAVEKSDGKIASGVVKDKIKVVGSVPKKKTGTKITFWPDERVFDDIRFKAHTICERLQVMAFLNKGLKIIFNDKRPDAQEQYGRVEYSFEGGISDFVKYLNSTKTPLFPKIGSISTTEDDLVVDIAWQWNTGYNEGVFSFANGISTTEGGAHVEGFRKALTTSVNKFAKINKILKDKDPNLQGDDIREGICAIVSVKVADPQFEGQTKTKLGNPSVRSAVEKIVNEQMYLWLEENHNEAKVISEKAKKAALARKAAKNAKDLTRRKTALSGSGLPGKLADCSSSKGETELFIVEGNSAGGSAKDARDPKYQAILPLRGKVLNVERASLDKIIKNAEIQSLISAIGGGIGSDFDLEKSRYSKIIILADADVDGGHIRALLITFFFRQMSPLVEQGRIYVAQPPLYSTIINKEKIYVSDEAEKKALVQKYPKKEIKFVRFKGLGEMDANELRETAMHPGSRKLFQLDIEQAVLADELFSILMGDSVEERRKFIESNAKEVSFVDA